ncbi:MAG: hypothetical protein M1829_004009 [Trizodia sp. TS-e1964]|nr:MAG: hypothetical protein M1829_004009 [Trizodia sp. TS-e1964]
MDGGPVPPSSPLRAESSSNSSSQGSKPKYHIATPLALLGRCASPVDCPVCGERALTKVIYKVGNTTHVWAAGLFATTILLSPLPYLFNSTKDRDHRCGNCDILLATWHKSGSVDVHQFVIS